MSGCLFIVAEVQQNNASRKIKMMMMNKRQGNTKHEHIHKRKYKHVRVVSCQKHSRSRQCPSTQKALLAYGMESIQTCHLFSGLSAYRYLSPALESFSNIAGPAPNPSFSSNILMSFSPL